MITRKTSSTTSRTTHRMAIYRMEALAEVRHFRKKSHRLPRGQGRNWRHTHKNRDKHLLRYSRAITPRTGDPQSLGAPGNSETKHRNSLAFLKSRPLKTKYDQILASFTNHQAWVTCTNSWKTTREITRMKVATETWVRITSSTQVSKSLNQA
jgi:hypothetical protein